MNSERTKDDDAKKEEWTIEKLCHEMYTQLDSKWTKDEKDGNMKRKYRMRARSYVRDLPKDGLVPFVIDDSDITGRVNDEFFNLEDGDADTVITEVVGRIFDSIDEPYIRLSVRDFVSCVIRKSEDDAYG